MESILKSLGSVPGVIGCLLIDDDGHAIAHSLPAMFDTSSLVEVSSVISNSIEGLHDSTGGIRFIDMRFELGRAFFKKMPKHVLLVLCEQNLNLQLMLISLNVVNLKLEKYFTQMPKPAPIAEVKPAAKQVPLAQQAQQAAPAAAGKVRTNDTGIILKTRVADKIHNMSADSIINVQTHAALAEFFRGLEIVNLLLNNVKSGKMVKTPVHVVKSDPGGSYDGIIEISPSIAGDIGAKDGDDLVVSVVVKKGFFG